MHVLHKTISNLFLLFQVLVFIMNQKTQTKVGINLTRVRQCKDLAHPRVFLDVAIYFYPLKFVAKGEHEFMLVQINARCIEAVFV
jgi:hypothetical protein